MREIRNNNFIRHKTDVENEPRKKYILAFEGEKTEEKYFTELLNNRRNLGINSLIDFVILERDICEKGVSNPKHLTNLLLNKMKEYNEKKISDISLISRLVNIVERYSIPRRKFNRLCKLYRDIMKSNCFVMFNFNDINKIKKYLYDILNNDEELKKIIDDYIAELLLFNDINYDLELDKICLIVDRDYDSFSEEQFDYVKNACEKNKITLCISNPFFEFWLLLHTENVLSYDKNNLKDKTFITDKLKEILGKYSKSNFNAESLIENIHTAIENEKEFCENIECLKNEIGSNVGILINDWFK